MPDARDDDGLDDKSLLIVLLETNPRVWESSETKGEGTAAALGLTHVLGDGDVFERVLRVESTEQSGGDRGA